MSSGSGTNSSAKRYNNANLNSLFDKPSGQGSATSASSSGGVHKGMLILQGHRANQVGARTSTHPISSTLLSKNKSQGKIYKPCGRVRVGRELGIRRECVGLGMKGLEGSGTTLCPGFAGRGLVGLLCLCAWWRGNIFVGIEGETGVAWMGLSRICLGCSDV